MSAFFCTNIGQVDSGVKVEQRRNTDGSIYWCAFTRVTHIFGAPIDGGEVEAFGTNEAMARERLEEELRNFNNSLWI